MAYPEWVEKQRRPGTNIFCIRGKYYLYEATSVWNKEKGRVQKKTGKYLGRITEPGLISPKARNQINFSDKISTKEYGASSFLCEIGKEILDNLRESFPEEAETIFSLSVSES